MTNNEIQLKEQDAMHKRSGVAILTEAEYANLRASRTVVAESTHRGMPLRLSESEISVARYKASNHLPLSEAERYQRDLDTWRELGQDHGFTGAALEKFAEGAMRGRGW